MEQPADTILDNEKPDAISFDPNPFAHCGGAPLTALVERAFSDIAERANRAPVPRPTLAQMATAAEALVSGVQNLVEQYLAVIEPLNKPSDFRIARLREVPKDVAEHAFVLLEAAVQARSKEIRFPD